MWAHLSWSKSQLWSRVRKSASFTTCGATARTPRSHLKRGRVKDIIEGVMELLERKNNHEGVEFLTLGFRDAFKQLHVVPSERRFSTGAAMGGFFSYRTVLFGVGSGPLVWGRGLTQHRAHTNCFVDDPIIPLKGTTSQRRKWQWASCCGGATLGLKLAYEKRSFGSNAVWIGTQI